VRRSWRSAAAFAAAPLALAGCGGGSPAPDPGAPVTRERAFRPLRDAESLDTFFLRLAAALERGGPRAYAATATGRQRARDARAARRIRGLGITDVATSVRSLDIGSRRARMDIRSLYRVRGISGRYAGARRLVAVKTARGWRVASETSRRERHPWELGRLVRRRTEHFVILAPPDVPTRELGAAFEDGYEALGDVLEPGRLRRRSLVVVAPDARTLNRLTRGIRGVESLAAITDSSVREAGPARRTVAVVSQRMLVSWPVFAGLDAATRRRIVTHELTHAALAGVTSGRTPAWLVEGIALYTSGDRRTAEAAQALARPAPPTLGRLAPPEGIARTSGARQSEAYAFASAAAAYVAERYGEAALLELYEAFNDEGLPGEAGDPGLTDRALRATLGLGRRAFERGLRRWLADA